MTWKTLGDVLIDYSISYRALDVSFPLIELCKECQNVIISTLYIDPFLGDNRAGETVKETQGFSVIQGFCVESNCYVHNPSNFSVLPWSILKNCMSEYYD